MGIDCGIISRGIGECDTSYESRKMWHEFKETAIFESRFFVKHRLLDILADYMKSHVINIEQGTVFYRARIIDVSARSDLMMYKCYMAPDDQRLDINYAGKANLFKGLSKEASFVPPREVKVKGGRANPDYIRYLYVSEDPTTAIFEVRPLINDDVNVAKILVNQSLRIANIPVGVSLRHDDNAPLNLHVMAMIQGAFAKPTNDRDDYIPTQVIAEYLKSLGYDGIRFKSSLHYGGVNLTIFNYQNCEAISSQHFRVEDTKLSARALIGSFNEKGDLFKIVDNDPKYLEVGLYSS